MGAGISKAQEYRIIYNALQRTLYKLGRSGVNCTYKNCQITGADASGERQFSVSFTRQNASNGECCMYPTIRVQPAKDAPVEAYSSIGQAVLPYDDGFSRVLELFSTTPASIRAKERLEYLRGELRAERISTGELLELQGLKEYIAPGDVELLEAAGVPEFPAQD